MLTPDLRADPVDWHSMAGWKRFVLMGLMVALPVPVFAASGLAVPLPSVVYRAAVGIAERTQAVAVAVPGFEAVVAETKQVARRGAIRLSAEELATRAAQPHSPASPKEARPTSAARPRPSASRAPPRGRAQKTSARRPIAAKPVGAKRAGPVHAVTKVAPPDAHADQRLQAPGRLEPATERKEPAAPEQRKERSDPSPVQSPDPKPTAPKEEPKGGPNPPPSPPPAVPPPPATLPPLPVTTPIDPLPEPVPLTPKAQLEGIAAALKEIADTRTVDRIPQALQKVQSAVGRLEKKPPDNQGAVGDIKNAVQKLDQALAEGEISLVERTLFVTRLNAVSKLL